MGRKALSIGALAAVFALLGSTTGVASVSALATASQEPTSPIAGCPNDSQPGKNYPNSEEEPTLGVFGQQMIAMYHQDRWSNGGAHGIGVGYSTGGTTWGNTVFPDDACSASVVTTPDSLSFYQRSSDPWVSFGPDGVAYASALSFDATDNKNSVAVGTSSDGGQTWTNMQPIPGSIFTSIDQSTDKNATTADPTAAGTAYTVWDTLISPTQHNPDDNPHPAAYSGPAYFSKTTDGGATWSTAKIIINTGQRQQTIGNIIVVDSRAGHPKTLYDFTDLLLPPNTSLGQGTNANAELAFVKSTDGGVSWTQPKIIAPFNSLGVVDPLNPKLLLRVGNGLEAVAIDPTNGKLFVVWETSSNFAKNTKQSTGLWDDEIVMATSDTGGATWSGPTVIHRAPNNSGLPTYTPEVAVNNGVVAVTYYDNRNIGANASFMGTDYFVSKFSEAGTFLGEQRITSTFDQLSAPFARGFFLGDYEGLQPSGTSGFEGLFVMTNCTSSDNGATFTGKCGPAEFTGGPTTSGNDNPTDAFAVAIS